MKKLGLSIGALWVLSAGFVLGSGCGPKAFTKGEYDDPNRVELLDDKFNEADLHQMANTVTDSMLACESISKASKPPFLIVSKVKNRTEEHIDTLSLTEKIQTQLAKSKKVKFINKEERGVLEEEYTFNESGSVDPAFMKKKGKQIGADYILSGALATNVQQVGNDKYIYYKLTMNLTNLDTSAIDCTEEKEIRKKFRKRSVGI